MGCGIQFPCDYVTPSDGEDDDDEDLPEEGEKPIAVRGKQDGLGHVI